MDVGRYRKKPVVVEAVEWDGDAAEATRIIDWILVNGGTAHYRNEEVRRGIYIDTLEGSMHCPPGSYVIRGIQGEFYPCAGPVFRSTYEPEDE